MSLELTQAEKEILDQRIFSKKAKSIDCSNLVKPSSLDLTEEEKAIFDISAIGEFIKNKNIKVTIEEAQEVLIEESLPEVDPVIQTHVYPVWKDLLDNLRANNGIAEIEGKITHVHIVGIIGDDLVIIPTKAIKVKDKLNWKADLKALKLDDKVVLESDKFIAKLDVITDAPDIEEMIRKYNDSVEADKQFTGFINI